MWHDAIDAATWGTTRPPLEGSVQADVAIVGGGYTGLWTAYYLLQRDPSLNVVVLEAEAIAFGASGRNGGWCSALLPMTVDAMAEHHGRDKAIRLQTEMHAMVAEVGRVVAHEGIDCGFARGGTVTVARNQAQLQRLTQHVQHLHTFGFDDSDYSVLDAQQAAARLNATKVIGGEYTPHCASVNPAQLARGLARAVEERGATIYEHSRVTELGPNLVRTANGAVHARVVVRATEAFASQMGAARDVAPLYSLMIATEPLPDSFWQQAGLAERETFADGRHMIIYGQRTADNRFAFGGRGAWYHWGSRMSADYERNPGVHAKIHESLRELFPALGDAKVTHRWGGAVAATRDWWCHVAYDATTGMASAGNYVGDGVGTTNLAGRTLADLITGADSELVALPWVGHRSKRWEPEPFRWLGINTMMVFPKGADRKEARTGKRSRWREWLLDSVLGG